MLPLPDQSTIFVDFFYSVQRDMPGLQVFIENGEAGGLRRIEFQVLQGKKDDPVFDTIVITDLEVTLAETLVPAYAV